MIIIPIEISARHIHLSQNDLEKLFGQNHQLTPIKQLSQSGQFACEEVVEIQNLQSWGADPHMDFTFAKAPDHNQVRVLGPIRKQTQVELSWSDFIALGLEPKVVLSGQLKDSAGGIVLVGPNGEIKLEQAVIIAQRHIHCSDVKAREYGLIDGQIVSVKVIDNKCQMSNINQDAPRALTFHNVAVRVSSKFNWQMHIDTDEANAAGIIGKAIGQVII